jgi:hypothetical protein
MRRDKPWTRREFYEDLEVRNGPKAVDTFRKIDSWIEQTPHTCSILGRGMLDGSIQVGRVRKKDLMHRGGFATFTMWTYGRISVEFEYLANHSPFSSAELRSNLLGRVNDALGQSLDESNIDKRPGLEWNLFVDDGRRKAFLEAMAWAIEQLHRCDLLEP